MIASTRAPASMMRLRALFSVTLCLALPIRARSANAQIDDTLKRRADSVVATFEQPGGPGCAIRVDRDGAPIYAHNFGLADIEHGLPITDQTRFDIASDSKQFTAAIVLMLVREGKLSLDDPVRRYVPELPAYASGVRIRHLLNQISGLRDYLDLFQLAGVQWETIVTSADALELLARQRSLNFAPGTEWAYSNTNYFLLAMIAERVTKKPLSQLLAERIFKPLGMEQTVLWTSHTQIVPDRAPGYAPHPGGGVDHTSYNWETTGDGAIISTAADMARWNQSLATAALLSRDQVTEMETPGTLAGGVRTIYGYGLVVQKYRGLPLIWHNGGSLGFRSDLSRFPAQHLSVIGLCNTIGINPSLISRRLADVFLTSELNAASGAVSAAQAPSGTGTLDASHRAALAGLYFSPQSGLLRTIADSGGSLVLVGGGPPRPLHLMGGERFDAGGGLTLHFTGAGASTALEERVGDGPITVYQRVPPAPPPTPALARGYEGTYESAELSTRWSIRSAGIQVVLRQAGLAATDDTLHADFADGFSSSNPAIRFVRDPKHRVTGLRVWTRGARGMLFTQLHQ